MRAPVYRNLDRPFRVLGFSPMELGILGVVLVVGGEVFQTFNTNRGWSFFLAAMLAVYFYLMRRFLGSLFIRRLVRFVRLPGQTRPKLILSRPKYSK